MNLSMSESTGWHSQGELYSVMSITPRLIVDELRRRSIKHKIISVGPTHAFISYEDELGNTRYVRNVITDKSGALSSRVVDNKVDSYAIARGLGINIPDTIILCKGDSVDYGLLDSIGPVVVKPIDSAHGNGVTVSIGNRNDLDMAIAGARKFSNTIILQKHVEIFNDFRLLFIGGKFAAASKRVPASVIGDGVSNIASLIEEDNNSDRRQAGYSESLSLIPIDVARSFLGERFYNEVPMVGAEVQVVGMANIGMGGVAINVTDSIDGSLVDVASRFVGALDLDVCGIDFIADASDNYYFLEANASPSFGLHHYPNEGEAVDVTSIFVNLITRGFNR